MKFSTDNVDKLIDLKYTVYELSTEFHTMADKIKEPKLSQDYRNVAERLDNIGGSVNDLLVELKDSI